MSIRDEISRDFREAEIDLGNQTFTWGGVSYACRDAPLERTVSIELGGNPVEIKTALFVRNEIFPDEQPPQTGDSITFDGRELLVASTQSIYGKGTMLALIDENS